MVWYGTQPNFSLFLPLLAFVASPTCWHHHSAPRITLVVWYHVPQCQCFRMFYRYVWLYGHACRGG